ncbi:MAG: serine/threonine-protein kinase [Myxococcota bacterium]
MSRPIGDELTNGSTDRGLAMDSAPDEADVVGETRPISAAEQDAEFAEYEPEQPRVTPGQSLGRYVILRQLAAGGMSVVHVAYDPELNREVALKVMRPGGPEGDVLASERLLREAQAMARLSHTNVVHVYDVGVVDRRVYMAMEFIRGDTLEEWLAKEERPWRKTIGVLVRAGRGLAAAHAAGLVHLDFKPRNVLVGNDGEVRVVDFGLARPPRSFDSAGDAAPPALDDERLRDLMTTSGRLIDPITQYGTVMGTPGYMAAEQLSAEAADARSDQFAFCVTAWVALYGVRPFSGDTPRELNHAVMIGAVKAPPTPRDVPVRVRRLLERGLRNDPDERHPSLDVLLDSLEADRMRPVRRGAAAVGVLAVVAGASYGFAASEQAGPTCDGGEELLAGAWDQDKRDAVATAIRADGRPFAQQVAEAVTASLDQWTGDWLAMHRESCEATHVRGEQSPELLDLRTRCLRRHLGELRALTDTLLAADATTVEHATEAVTGLGRLEACADVEQLTATMPALEPELQKKVDAVYDRMAVGSALERAGNYPVALVHVMEGALAAELLGYLPLIVQARGSVGAMFTELGNAEAAEEMLQLALHAADEAGMDDKRLSLTMDLIFVLGLHRGQFERAHRLARNAEAIAQRIEAGVTQQSRLVANEGAVFGAEGQPHKSIERYAQALKLQSEMERPDRSNLASIHLGMGAAYHLIADYEKGLRHFEQSRDLMVVEFGARHPRTATSYENIGTAYQAMGRFEEAKQQFRTARSIFNDALMSESGQASLLVGLAAAHEGLEEYEEAAALFERVIELLAEEGRETPVLAVAMGNLAGIHVETGHYEDALAMFGEQLPLLERIAGPDHVYAYYFRVGKARALFGLGRTVEALAIIGPVVEGYRSRTEETDPLHRGEATLLLARAVDELGDEPPPPGLEELLATDTVADLAADARVLLETAGIPGHRPLRRLADFERRLRRRKKADQPSPR